MRYRGPGSCRLAQRPLGRGPVSGRLEKLSCGLARQGPCVRQGAPAARARSQWAGAASSTMPGSAAPWAKAGAARLLRSPSKAASLRRRTVARAAGGTATSFRTCLVVRRCGITVRPSTRTLQEGHAFVPQPRRILASLSILLTMTAGTVWALTPTQVYLPVVINQPRPTATPIPTAAPTPTAKPQAPATPTPGPTSGPACDASYPTVCIPPPPPDLDCGDIPDRRFPVRAPDPHNFDSDHDGIGCETG
jgi:hypothetical protein